MRTKRQPQRGQIKERQPRQVTKKKRKRKSWSCSRSWSSGKCQSGIDYDHQIIERLLPSRVRLQLRLRDWAQNAPFRSKCCQEEAAAVAAAADEDKKRKLLTQSKQLNRMTRRQCQCNRSQSKSKSERETETALEERISTAINDFGCVFTTLTGEKMGSTSTAHSIIILPSSSLSVPLFLSRTVFICSFIHESWLSL